MHISRFTDYASLILASLSEQKGTFSSAALIAHQVHLPPSTVAKILKLLTKAGLLHTARGKQGGYQLAKEPTHIPLLELIEAIEGPLYLTDCTLKTGDCPLETYCEVQRPWKRIHQGILTLLEGLTLKDLLKEAKPS